MAVLVALLAITLAVVTTTVDGYSTPHQTAEQASITS